MGKGKSRWLLLAPWSIPELPPRILAARRRIDKGNRQGRVLIFRDRFDPRLHSFPPPFLKLFHPFCFYQNRQCLAR
ncbi:hypothetical protein CPSG_05606 [Coccidioides posadasii str. Silveira]|uniref:Uncharacterized protein n=1 Tax=Coccidioides posadasii (strain RMSCC 757 / Silveira) TaxID=443226 RepID=E9D6U7_COCPS|nr:hypothetical protein CPSG_05606 [Coccidioides posadasii str. Silveira]